MKKRRQAAQMKTIMLDEQKTEYANELNALKIIVTPIYDVQESEPEDGYFVWNYQVRLENHSDHNMQVQQRYAKVVDGQGRVENFLHADHLSKEYRTKLPELKAGEYFEFTSAAHLSAPSAIIEGSYYIKNVDTNTSFVLPLPTFSLDSPYTNSVLH